MIKLSIIIPFFNVENYIGPCLDSVFNQDIPLDEYEVICVNDGSLDGSRDVVLSYKDRYSNLRLIEHDKNKKLGSARNTGRSIANGKYIWNVDSDDLVATNCLARIIKVCEERDLDVLEFSYTNIYPEGLEESTSLFQIPRDEKVYSGPEYVSKFYYNNIAGICSIWRKIYRRSFLEKENISSPPINMGEDMPFAISIFGTAKRISYLEGDFYRYRRRDMSLSGSKRVNWPANRWYEATFVCTKYSDIAFRKYKSRFTKNISDLLDNMIECCLSIWRTDSFKNIDDKKTFWSLCRKHFFENLFIFRYLSRRAVLEYTRGVFNLYKFDK